MRGDPRPLLPEGRVDGRGSQKLGVEVEVELVGLGATAPLTQIEARQKPIRLIDH